MTEKPSITADHDSRREVVELQLLRERLRAEGETELLGKIALCQEPLQLKCTTCGTKKVVRQRCKRKWCPCCKKQLASNRSMEMEFIVDRFRWILFVTLTMKNESDLSNGGVRRLRRAFGKLRHRKLWKSRVRGGVATVEVTNIPRQLKDGVWIGGHGWHPHLHAVVDCQWLAWKTPAPQRRDSVERKKELFKQAAQELEATWAKLLGQQTASVKVKRAYRGAISKEVVKYTVKSEDLIECHEPIGDLIRAIDSCRMMTTFGRAHGQCVKDVRLAAKADAKARRVEWLEGNLAETCCPAPEFLLAEMTESPRWDARTQATRRMGAEKRAVRLACEAAT